MHFMDRSLDWLAHQTRHHEIRLLGILSTMIDEIVAVLPQVDAVVASVGGGGLLSGILTGLLRHGRTDCRVIACETAGAASFRAALDAGHPVKLDRIDSIAKSLAALQGASWPVDAIKQFPHEP